MDDRVVQRFNAEIAGRPQLVTGDAQILYGGMSGLTESSLLNIKNKSFAVTAELVIHAGIFNYIRLPGFVARRPDRAGNGRRSVSLSSASGPAIPGGRP